MATPAQRPHLAHDVSAKPQLTLHFDPPGPDFAISEECEMPKITASAVFKNLVLDPRKPLAFHWKVGLEFDGRGCRFAVGRHTRHTPIVATTYTNTFPIEFTQVRGGHLNVEVTVVVEGKTYTAHSQHLRVVGTNPSRATLARVIHNLILRQLMQFESGGLQFLNPWCPLFSRDLKGGVGICQITNPRPTDEQVWSWMANYQAGEALFQQKMRIANQYSARVRHGEEILNFKDLQNFTTFAKLAAEYNARRRQGKPPLIITLPDFTDEQLDLATVREYNGYAERLHEFRVATDDDGFLVVRESGDGKTGQAQWMRVSTEERRQVYMDRKTPRAKQGDPGYVDHVLAQPGF